MSFEFDAISVLQKKGARPFYLMAASAENILKWADVPRKKADYMAGYQRGLDKRHKKISEFLRLDAKNIIPGAVIIAADEEKVAIEKTGGSRATVSVSYTGAFDLGGAVASRLEEFRSRLSDEELASAESIAERLSDGAELLGDPDDDGDQDEDVIPESYLSYLTAELMLAARDWGSLSDERQEAVEEYLKGTSKPGLILDGQHRIFGAKAVEAEAIVLPVVLMPGLDDEEQVFHFYVLNNKARPLKPTELRATVSTSLTDGEIYELEERLRQAGVKSEQAAWTHKINTDPRSPFRGLINFGLTEESPPIGENVMHQVAKILLAPSRKYRMLFDSADKWEDLDYRLEVFFTQWDAVREKYPNAWTAAENADKNDVERQIFYKASLRVLQEYLLDTLLRAMPKRMRDDKGSPIDDLEDFREEVEAALYFLPEEFFTKEWMEKGLDHQGGRELLRSQLESAINQQGKNLGNMTLFRKQK